MGLCTHWPICMHYGLWESAVSHNAMTLLLLMLVHPEYLAVPVSIHIMSPNVGGERTVGTQDVNP